MSALARLAAAGCVALDEEAFGITATEPGRLMAQSYVAFETVAAAVAAPRRACLPDLLLLLARAREFEHIKLRRCVCCFVVGGVLVGGLFFGRRREGAWWGWFLL